MKNVKTFDQTKKKRTSRGTVEIRMFEDSRDLSIQTRVN
jgi:hypothetical protein